MKTHMCMSSMFLLFIVVVWSLVPFGYGYKTDPESSHTHEELVLRALEKLESFSFSNTSSSTSALNSTNITSLAEATTTMRLHESVILQAQSDADWEMGTAEYFSTKVGRGSFTHYYNPATEQGLRIATRLEEQTTARNNGLLPGSITQVMGPVLDSPRMVMWYYARAIHRMNEGDEAGAMHDLSYAINIVQDATVPMHSNDCSPEDDWCQYNEYQEFVETFIDEYETSLSPLSTIEILSNKLPEELTILASELSNPLLQDAQDTTKRQEVANSMLNLAVDMTCALVLRFFQTYRSTDISPVVVFRIDYVQMKGELIGSYSEADFRPYVTLGDESEKTAGFISDMSYVTPQDLLDAHGWTFVHRMTTDEIANGEMQVTFAVHDVKGSECSDDCGDILQQLAIDGSDGYSKTVNFKLTDEMISSESSGCNGNICSSNSVMVSYTIARSYNITGLYNESFQSTLGKAGLAFFFLVLALSGAVFFLFTCITAIFCRRKKRWQARKTKHASPISGVSTLQLNTASSSSLYKNSISQKHPRQQSYSFMT